MLRLAAVVALLLAGAANAAGPSPGLLQGPSGITTPAQKYRFVTLHGARTTKLAAIDKATGRVVRSHLLRGEWGIPYVAFDGTVDGLSRDGRTLVIADWVLGKNSPFRPSSSFRIYGTKLLDLRSSFTLRRAVNVPSSASHRLDSGSSSTSAGSTRRSTPVSTGRPRV